MERYLVENCSPTLASLKTGNLFSYKYDSLEEVEFYVEFWNQCMAEKGVSVCILKIRKQTALIYVFRKNFLERDMKRPGVAELLKKCGYESTDADYALRHLRGRLENNEDFPHEIGLFLGYPLGDVIGFVENEGRNSLCCGCWKVYCNECEALQTFLKFKKCTEIYTHLWNQGKSVLQLTVAA